MIKCNDDILIQRRKKCDKENKKQYKPSLSSPQEQRDSIWAHDTGACLFQHWQYGFANLPLVLILGGKNPRDIIIANTSKNLARATKFSDNNQQTRHTYTTVELELLGWQQWDWYLYTFLTHVPREYLGNKP